MREDLINQDGDESDFSSLLGDDDGEHQARMPWVSLNGDSGAYPNLICVCVSQTQIEKKRLTRSKLPLKVKKLVANRKYL